MINLQGMTKQQLAAQPIFRKLLLIELLQVADKILEDEDVARHRTPRFEVREALQFLTEEIHEPVQPLSGTNSDDEIPF